MIYLFVISILILLILYSAWNQAKGMTLFTKSPVRYTGIRGILQLAFKGLQVKRPYNTKTPDDVGLQYETICFTCADNTQIELWKIPIASSDNSTPPGKISISFNWFGSSKEDLLRVARVLHERGFEVWLGDFPGHGGSSGDTTSLGWYEGQHLAEVISYIQRTRKAKKTLLHGISLSAVAATRAFYLCDIHVDGVILECPYDRLLNTVKLRVKSFHIPAWPLAYLMLAMGSIQQRFNAFRLNPVSYASEINAPTLLLHSGDDPFIKRSQAWQVAQEINPPAIFKEFPGLGHGSISSYDIDRWKIETNEFLDTCGM